MHSPLHHVRPSPNSAHNNHDVKELYHTMNKQSGSPAGKQLQSPGGQAIPVAVVLNENWRGKNDPTERRRIQNRLNQRAFRQRQRARESPKQYNRQSIQATSRSSQEQEESFSEEESDSSAETSEGEAEPRSPRAYTQPPPRGASQTTQTTTAYEWDELAQLINRNLMAATATNAQHLGIILTAHQTGTASCTPRPARDRTVPATLQPIELQYQVAHDPIIDTIPHARLRFNILRAIATRQLDAAVFVRSIRASGILEQTSNGRERIGLVVWSAAEQVASWEVSESFVRRWAFLLQGCEDLIAATNAWRSRRGERPFQIGGS